MIDPLQANWQILSDTDVIGLLRNSEGRNSTDRALFLEAARRIEAQSAAIAAAVQAEREAILTLADELEFKPSKWSDLLTSIRARNGRKRDG